VTLEEQAAALEAEQTAHATTQADLEAAATVLLAGVPEHLKGLIPATMSAKERIDWFAQAKATGIFDRNPVATTDDGTKPTITPKAPDSSSLPPYARMAAGYRK